MQKPPSHMEPLFYKSSHSGGDTNDCVEVANAPQERVHMMRDTKHRDLGALGFDTRAWAPFLGSARK